MKILIIPDEIVGYKGRDYKISQIVDSKSVIAVALLDGTIHRLLIKNITLPNLKEVETKDKVAVSDNDWQIAQFRYSIIRPLLENKNRTTEQVETQSKKANVHRATIYRWIEAFETVGLVSSLMPSEKSGGKGKGRLKSEIEAIISNIIEELYFDEKKPSFQKICDAVIKQCHTANLLPPHPNTIRNRITIISEKFKLQKNIDVKPFIRKYKPMVGLFPGKDWPLAVIQIDHAKLDTILVDSINRKPIGVPWVTMAIDMYSRMIIGIYVSFDTPEILSVGLCLAHAIIPKEKWLADHNLTTIWPVWGALNIVNADNINFAGEPLKKACFQYGMEFNWKPEKKPKYGIYIQKLLGTFLEEVNFLLSKIKPAMTLYEFEAWLADYITRIYHQKDNKEIGTSPINKYEEGILGNSIKPGCGLPSKKIDEDKLKLDFMPFIKCHVQSLGINIDGIYYYSNLLKPWIKARDPENRKRKRLFFVRRDPHDISVIYFYDPEVNIHYKIPYRDKSRPIISLWDLRLIKNKIREANITNIDEDLIFETYLSMFENKASYKKQHIIIDQKVTQFEHPQDRIEPFDEIEEN